MIPWTAEETALLMGCNSRQEAKQKYREMFPDIPRLPATIGRRFYDVRPEKREPKWTDAEKVPIQTADTVECAIAEHLKLFPQSTRSLAAIRREWYELRPEKRYLVSCGRKKGGRNKAPLPGTARERYNIPFSTKQDKRGYNHAVYICNKFDLPYAEALELERQGAPFELQEKPEWPNPKLIRSLFRLQEKILKVKEKPPKKVRVPKEKTPRKPRQVKVKPVLLKPEILRCVMCGSPISPSDFEYTEKTGLCIPCWEETDVEDLVIDMVDQTVRVTA